MRIRILSDLHLGHSSSKVTVVEMLAPLLNGVDHVILAGDIWQERVRGERRQRAYQHCQELLAMIQARGISVDLLRGNHDPSSGGGVSRLCDGAILVTHGDAIYDTATPWSRELPRQRKEIEEIVQSYADRSHLAESCAERAREIASAFKETRLPKLPPPFNYFATALWPPSRSFEMIRVFFDMGKQGIRFLKHSGEGARVLVCGHFHKPGIWEKDGYLMINTGAFMRGSRPWMVDVNEGSKITARDITQRNGAFHPGSVKGRWLLAD